MSIVTIWSVFPNPVTYMIDIFLVVAILLYVGLTFLPNFIKHVTICIAICDQIYEKGSYTRIQFFDFKDV